jgi:tRNA threonylcarbamoyladenosine biosynthesis protein TsaE
MKKRIDIPNLEELPEAAGKFLESIGNIPVVAFSGELGAGKTTFIQALCGILGVRADVSSPTFALINEYFTPAGKSVYHFDLYRVEDPGELFDLGYEEYFYSGERCFIEWPEKAAHLIPEDAIIAEIRVLENGSRAIEFELPKG